MCSTGVIAVEHSVEDTLQMYSPAVLDHFQNPRHPGALADATATARVANPVCGDTAEISVRVENGHITEARFRAQGCVTAIACSSVLTEMLLGKAVGELDGINPDKISDYLGGLPPATFHGAQLACDAIKALLAQLD
jgi:nitrogen fixation NifU-like protein